MNPRIPIGFVTLIGLLSLVNGLRLVGHCAEPLTLQQLLIPKKPVAVLQYETDRDGVVHFGELSYQEGAFRTKRVDILESLKSPSCGGDCSLAGRYADIYWSRNKAVVDQLKVTDLRSTIEDGMEKRSALAVKASSESVALDGLFVLFLGTPIFEPNRVKWEGGQAQGKDWFGARFTINATEQGPQGPTQLTSIIYSSPQTTIERKITLQYRPQEERPHFGSVVSKNLGTGRLTTNTFRIMEYRVAEKPLPREHFLWHSDVFDDVPRLTMYTNKVRLQYERPKKLPTQQYQPPPAKDLNL